VRATSLVNGTPRFLDLPGSKTPQPIDIKFDRGDYVGDITQHANFRISIPKGGRLYICVKLSSSVSIFFTPRYFFIPCTPVEIALFDRFSCFMAQKTCFGDSYVFFEVRIKNFNNFHYFSPKKREIPYSRNVKIQSTVTLVLQKIES